MSRPITRRLTALGLAGGCLAAAAPALAAESGTADGTSGAVTVSVTAVKGNRQFDVFKDGTTDALTRLDFTGDAALPFTVRVKDTDRALSGDFEVNARMSNLYRRTNPGVTPAAYDEEDVIPSRAVALGYDGARPLDAAGISLPITPLVTLTGELATCQEAGITAPLAGVPLVGSLMQSLDLLCDTLLGSGGGSVTGTHVAGVEKVVQLALGDALTLVDLPVALRGGQEGGPFAKPSYDGVAAQFAPATAEEATRHVLMTGRPDTSAAALLSAAAAALTADGATVLPRAGSTSSLVALPTLISEISEVVPGLTTEVVESLTSSQLLALVSTIEGTVVPGDQVLSTVSGDYYSYPELAIDRVASVPGVYEGTLIVDFFDGLNS